MGRSKLRPPTRRRRAGRGARRVNLGWWTTVTTIVVLGVVGVVVSRGANSGGDIVHNVTMPDIGGAEKISVSKVASEPYDRVKEGDVLFEVKAGDTTEKVTSPIDGFFVEQLVQAGQSVEPGTELGTVQTGVDFNTANRAGWHWHAAYGVNVCGQWLSPLPETQTDVHTHGDGLLHLEARSNAGAGRNSSLGTILDILGAELTATRLEYLGETYESGDVACGEGENKTKGVLRWALNGKDQKSNPANLIVGNGDVIALAFVPEGEELQTLVPSAAALGENGSPVNHPDFQPAETTPAAPPPEDAGTTPTTAGGG